jgi:hypothetical protein
MAVGRPGIERQGRSRADKCPASLSPLDPPFAMQIRQRPPNGGAAEAGGAHEIVIRQKSVADLGLAGDQVVDEPIAQNLRRPACGERACQREVLDHWIWVDM